MARFLDFFLSPRNKRYGGYELVEQVARGGMSRIWKVRHPETDQIYAMKVLTPESSEAMRKFRALFEAEEGQIALRLNHPNVVNTIEYGRGSEGEYYIVMEYLDGQNLEMLIVVESPRVRENSFDLLLQIGQGLRYIHGRGLVHRDFCPKNVIYCKDGTAKIIDFGLTIPASLKARSVLARAGTASYMAPEQIRSQPVDERADIYAFGVSAFEILTGRRPFPRSADRSRRMQDHLNVEPLPLRQVQPDLPAELERVIQKCVAKDRDMRYKSMGRLMKDLQVAVQKAQPRQD